jgi:acetolactate synthase-1/2/3 large subunit
MGKGVVSEALPQYIGTAALTANDYIHPIIDMADLLIVVGYDIVEKPTNYRHNHPDRQVIHINFTPADVDDIYMPQLEVVGDIGNTLWQLYESDLDRSMWDFSTVYDAVASMKQAIQSNISLEDAVDVLMPRKMIADLRSIL